MIGVYRNWTGYNEWGEGEMIGVIETGLGPSAVSEFCVLLPLSFQQVISIENMGGVM